jgi:hypothetical protein
MVEGVDALNNKYISRTSDKGPSQLLTVDQYEAQCVVAAQFSSSLSLEPSAMPPHNLKSA